MSDGNSLTEDARYLLSSRKHLSNKNLAEKHLKIFLSSFVVTQDEHDNEYPFKKIPYRSMPHIGYIASLWTHHNLLCIAKSRQLMATWLFCAILLWDTMFKTGRLNIIIDKREDDANETIDRCRFIYDNLPGMIKNFIRADKTPQGQIGSYCKLSFEANKSMIRGLPQNPDSVRKNTASNLFIDEAAFIERAEQCYTAALPAVRGGGKMVINSTPKGQNFFFKLYSDSGKNKNPIKEIEEGTPLHNIINNPPDGITTKMNSNGFVAVRLHYTAVPKYCSPEWKANAKAGYQEDQWEQEMEINFTLAGTSKVYPMFNYETHVRKLSLVKEYPIMVGWDYGYHHPAVVIAQIDNNDTLNILDEILGTDITIRKFTREVIDVLRKRYKYHYQTSKIQHFGDPAGNQQNDKSEFTSIQIQRKMGVFVRYKKASIKQGVRVIQQLLIGREEDKPLLKIDPKCKILIDGFSGGYTEDAPVRERASKEIPFEDDYYSHCQDALRYLVINKYPAHGVIFRQRQKELRSTMFNPLEDDNLSANRQSLVTGYY